MFSEDRGERISSRWTAVFKIAVPLLIVLLLGMQALAITSMVRKHELFEGLAFVGIGVVALYQLAVFRWRLSQVWVDDEGLVIENRGHEELVPFEEIAQVVDRRGHPHVIVLHLCDGRKRCFIARGEWYVFQAHPLAVELREIIKDTLETHDGRAMARS